ncbi:hypothetical protein [Natronorarus salvus]|uniref:hypothetical protein n=1 Tax=Natronorarus salvus TaxID=3117733 RepID=UPI002F266BC8
MADTEKKKTTNVNDGSDLEIAHAEDYGIQRDSEGEILPTIQAVPGLDGKAVKVKPPEPGEYQEYKDVFDEDEGDDDRVDEFLRTFIVDGIGSGGLDEVPPLMVPGLIKAVENAAGGEVFRAVEQIETQENMAAVRAMGDMDPETLSRFAEMGRELNGNGQGQTELHDTVGT